MLCSVTMNVEGAVQTSLRIFLHFLGSLFVAFFFGTNLKYQLETLDFI